MNAKRMAVRRMLVQLCALSMAAVMGCLSSNVPDRADMAKEGESLMVVRIAEIEVLSEYLDPYLAAAGNVGAESVAKEPGVVCIFPMQRKTIRASYESWKSTAAKRRTRPISRRRTFAHTKKARRT